MFLHVKQSRMHDLKWHKLSNTLILVIFMSHDRMHLTLDVIACKHFQLLNWFANLARFAGKHSFNKILYEMTAHVIFHLP